METTRFNGVKETKTGIEIKDVRFNTAIGLYLGMVADPLWVRSDRKFITCTWNGKGKCINRNRPELDLI